MPDRARSTRRPPRDPGHLFWLALSLACAVLTRPVGANDDVTFDVFAAGGEFLGRVRGDRPSGRLVYRHGRAYQFVAITDDERPTVDQFVLTLGSALTEQR